MRVIKINQKGDTIIEVLICLAILGFVLTLAYSIGTRSLGSIRSSQERTEALKIAEGQLEQIKYLGKKDSPDPAIFSGLTDPICIKSDGTPSNTFSPRPDDPDLDDFSAYDSECTNRDGLYNIYISRPAGSDGGIFTVRVRWERYGGGANQEVKLEYFLNKGP